MTTVIMEAIVQQTKLFASQRKVRACNSAQKNCKLSLASMLQWVCYTSRKYGITGQQVATPWLPSIMSRDHFFKILRYLHLLDSAKQKKKDEEEEYDILYKVCPLINHLAAVFRKYYQLSCNISIDETMIGTR